jgi:hypothetical protein
VGPFKSKSEHLMTHMEVRGRVCETDMARVRVGQGMAGQNYCVVLIVVSFSQSCVEGASKTCLRSGCLLCSYCVGVNHAFKVTDLYRECSF